MLFYKILAPDILLPSYGDYTAEFLKGRGISFLICDIDNTLVTYDDPEPTDRVLNWLHVLEREGIKVAFVSNNDIERVERFNRDLGYIAYAKSGKPFADKLLAAIREAGAEREGTALLGDQLFTDVLAARNAHITAFAVPPINDKRTFFWRFKRRLERPIIKKYARNNEASLPEGLDLATWAL